LFNQRFYGQIDINRGLDFCKFRFENSIQLEVFGGGVPAMFGRSRLGRNLTG